MANQDQDLPLLDEEVSLLPSDIRADLAERGRHDLYFLVKGILGYHRLTAGCHGPLCTFMDENSNRFKLVLMPRDHYKTTTCTIGGNLQQVLKDVESRVLIANENATNAARFMGIIKSHVESNRVFRALYSDIIPKDTRRVRWNASELEFERQGHYAEPTIDSIGMTGAMTSRHYTHICVDDPISEEAIKSELVMHDVITRIDKLFSLMVEPERDTFWLVGTRWGYNDVVSFFLRKLGHRFARFVRGAVEDGQPIFPELLSLETLADIRNTIGEYMYSALYMNAPRDPDTQDFNVGDVRFWRPAMDGESMVLYTRDGEVDEIVRRDQLDVTMTVDPAPAETARSDRNATTVTGVTPSGKCVVLEAWGARCSPLGLIEHIIDVWAQWRPRVVGIEDVAYQKTLKYFLSAECARRGIYIRVEPVKANGKKEARIRGLQPIAATGRLYVQPTMHLLRDELSDFPLGEHDDVLDSLSMHQQLWRSALMSPERWRRYRESEARLLQRVDGYGVHEEGQGPVDAAEDAADWQSRPGTWVEHVVA